MRRVLGCNDYIIRPVVGFLTAALVLLASVGNARAEWVLDAFFGIPIPRGGETEADRTAANYFIGAADIDENVAFGLRFGRFTSLASWLDVGGMLDASAALGTIGGNFGTTGGGVNFDFVPVSGLLMARFPILKSEEIPYGMFQPYIGIGPSMVWSQLNQNVFNDARLDGGAAGVGGLKVMFWENFGIFAEYRLNYFEAKYDSQPLPSSSLGHLKVRSLTHTPTIGVSWHFDLPAAWN